ncbi:hypothetical protein ARAF_0603 [Arsenophonus endosymbiont of Aleurodicus floccissimus]|uniref:toxin TcdB middle/C-terminal domain-containing protein n=1 Tax=Arsenophonus endosymbiont of Aleurodicus floccissimus TaxID=2152761 RepID=UPI000E6B3879|nr:toxin TcdB middle/C-terminal domain-containing protein [Arsenophonus endosymbiont of Aleurodicus floccissimus]SPP31475.1 hypothetical protein ARAF_0603 [Arsenophonus endosymbiont of Aleurodicus floccissimus]
MSLEQWDYNYERITEDPLYSQNVNLAFDDNGAIIHNVAINYPRRPISIIPPSIWLPDGNFEQSYDPQQLLLRISENKIRFHNLKTPEQWRLNIADIQQTDMITLPASDVPAEGFSLESLLNPDGILSENTPREYAGQSKIYYLEGGDNKLVEIPTIQALVAFTEQAELDKQSFLAFEPVLSASQIEAYLTNAGYIKTKYLFPRPGEETADIWIARLNYSEYYDEKAFYYPYRQRHLLLTGATDYQWDKYYCVVISTTDAAGFYTQADYNYRFLMPYSIKDINDNISYVDFDAFGRISSSRIWGTEEGQLAGFPPPDEVPFMPPDTIDAALSMPTPQPVAQFYFYAPAVWMKPATKDFISAVTNSQHQYNQVVNEQGYVNFIGYQRWLRKSNTPVDKVQLADDTERQSPYILTVNTDRYYPDEQQQQRQQINFIDGAGRSLQTALRDTRW